MFVETLVATLVSPVLIFSVYFHFSGKDAISDFVNSHDASKRMIDLVNVIYKMISWVRVEKNLCVIDTLIVYPIKSVGRGLLVKEWMVGETGLMYDRQYLFTRFDDKTKEWVPVTLKDCPQFINIEYEVDEGFFVIKYAAGRSFKLPMEVTPDYLDSVREKDSFTVRLWLENMTTYDISSVLPEDFVSSTQLPEGIRLTYTVEGHQVVQGSLPNLQDTVNGSKYRISKFQDYYPFLIISQTDLRHLNKRLSDSKEDFRVNESSFRPNIVVEGDIPPHDEDSWYKFRFNTSADSKSHYLNSSIKCARCSIPNIDVVGDGKLHKRGPVTRAISKYRRVDIGDKYLPFFGVYAIQHDTNYLLKAGDSVDVLQRKVNFYDSPFG